MIARGRKYRKSFTGRWEVTFDGRTWWTLPRRGFPDCTICEEMMAREVVRSLGDTSLGHCKARDCDMVEMPRICEDYSVAKGHPTELKK